MSQSTHPESDTQVRRRRANWLARRANLPTSGELRGRITIVQEDRFRLEDAEGRGYLLTAGRKSGVSMADLNYWREGQIVVTVTYEGPPDLGAIATRIRV